MAINLNDLKDLLDQAGAASANEKEIRKGLTRIENLLGNINKEVTSVYALLDGAAPAKAKKEPKTRAPKEAAEIDPSAPYGRRKDGTPKIKPGRTKTEEVAA